MIRPTRLPVSAGGTVTWPHQAPPGAVRGWRRQPGIAEMQEGPRSVISSRPPSESAHRGGNAARWPSHSSTARVSSPTVVLTMRKKPGQDPHRLVPLLSHAQLPHPWSVNDQPKPVSTINRNSVNPQPNLKRPTSGGTTQTLGAPERIRTADTRFRRAVLYPLSYRRVGRCRPRVRRPGAVRTTTSLPGTSVPAESRQAGAPHSATLTQFGADRCLPSRFRGPAVPSTP